MEILFFDRNCIIKPFSPILNKREIERIKKELYQHSNYTIALDLSYVKDCTIDFINAVLNIAEINLYNVPSDILALLTMMGIDKKVNIFNSQLDFKEGKRRLINRQLKILK